MSEELDRRWERVHELEKQLLDRIEDYDAIIAQLKKPQPAATGFYAVGIDVEITEQQIVNSQGDVVVSKTVTLSGVTFNQGDVLEVFDSKGNRITLQICPLQLIRRQLS